MKRVILLSLLVSMASATFLTSCTKDDASSTSQTAAASASSTATGSRANLLKCGSNQNNNNCNNGGNNNCNTTCGNGGHQNCNGATPESPCGTPTTVNLIACQTTGFGCNQNSTVTVGTVEISNGPTSMTLTYTTTGNYNLQSVHVYVGTNNNCPTGYSGGCNASQFPYQSSQCASGHTYSVTIPLSGLPSCFCVVAEAQVGCNFGWPLSANADGTTYSNRCGRSGGTFVSYCKQTCTPHDTCVLPASLLFSGETSLPNNATSVTVGGYTYTVAAFQPVFAEPSNDAQSALFAVAVLKVYGNLISPPSTVTTASATVEAWLATKGQLTASSNFTAPANVETAIAVIQAWEQANACS